MGSISGSGHVNGEPLAWMCLVLAFDSLDCGCGRVAHPETPYNAKRIVTIVTKPPRAIFATMLGGLSPVLALSNISTF